MEFPTKIAEALNRPRPFPLTYFATQAFTITNKNKSSFMGATLIYFILAVVTVFLLSIIGSFFAPSVLEASSTPSTFSVVPMVYSIVLWGTMLFIAAPIGAGYAQAAYLTEKDEPLTFDAFFAGYKWPKWLHLFITTLILTALLYIIIIPVSALSGMQFLEIYGSSQSLDLMELSAIFDSLKNVFLLLGLLIFAIRAIYMWGSLITYFFDIKGWAALEASRRLMGWNFLWVILFDVILYIAFIVLVFFLALLATVLGSIVGALFIFLFCFIFMLYFIPYYLNFQYVSFAETVRLTEDESKPMDEDRIIDHFMPE